MNHKTTTESASHYSELENMSTEEIVYSINQEDLKVATAVQKILPKITLLVEEVLPKFLAGGRLVYIGAGTSGRLGILDASEIPPTFGLDHGRVVGLIAGGDSAIRKSVEFAEDSTSGPIIDLQKINLTPSDTLIGIAASGTTPYVIAGVEYAKSIGALTGCITNNMESPLSKSVKHPLEIVVGPEFVTGSTRMKSGTAQKLVLNTISTALMIRIGRVKGNKMIHMQLSNNKLVRRGAQFIMEELNIDIESAQKLLEHHGSVDKVINSINTEI